ncbi:2OG-Fe(II) oxygenase superfamily protein [Apiospora marii]|uniref:2OG-Fe(II) oxygenase superfamily protein n=1 Tax=Apiospora marii TaxID=335849 RepID=A0ABR1RZC2_9PEZI
MTTQDSTRSNNQIKPDLPKWQRPEKTQHDLPWADIQIIDLSTFDDPGGKEKLAAELRDAIHHTGFFSVVGSGISGAEVQRQYDIAQAFFALPHEAKAKPEYKCDFANGNYFGYREIYEATIRGTEVRNNVEQWNHAKFTALYAGEARHPFFAAYEGEIAEFSRKALGVAQKLLELCALILELPPAFFADQHHYESTSDDHLRYMSYRPRPRADDARVDNTWARAHTDFGTLTLLWSQNVAGLQIKTANSYAEGEDEGSWKYVPPVETDDNTGIICNVGDALDFWSASYLKSTTHRVVRPPPDQLGANRLGLFYFVRPGDDAEIKPAAASPLLRRLGLVKGSSEEKAQENGSEEGEKVTGKMYVRERVKDYHSHGDYADRTGQVFQVGNLRIVDEAR